MTDPWDKRYIHLHEWLIFVGFHVGKFTLRPMDPSWDRVPQRPSSPPPVAPIE